MEAQRTPSTPLIEFDGVSKTYKGGTHALQDVNIKINKGEFVFIVGSSGAGKSTFMKLIMREEKPNTGEITVNGFKLTKMKRKDVPYFRRTMGIVFQDFRLIPNMNVFDNVAFAMHVVGASRQEIRKNVSKALNLVGLAEKARCKPAELSGGEQQRVSLARALANNPKIIIADEPTANVDPRMSLDIMNLLIQLNQGGRTVIVITHDKNLVDFFQKRVVVIEDGVIIEDRIGGMFNA